MSEELRELLRTLPSDGADALDMLFEGCPEVLAATGAGIMLMTDDVQRGSLRSSDDLSALLEELQFDLGEGPCVDAHTEQQPVLEPDLAAPDFPRWPAFSPPALAAGVGAVFGFPMSVGATRLGSLNVYRRTAGAMDQDQITDARQLADLMAIEVLDLQAEADDGEISDDLARGADLQDRVHQATGMVAAQLEISVTHALRVLHAHARAEGSRLQEVATEVVARRLRFDPPDDRTDL